MTRILIMSDSHSFWDKAAEEYIEKADEVWHAGDFGSLQVFDKLRSSGKQIRVVFGNIDGRELRYVMPEKLVWEIEGVKICMTHIGGYPGHYAPGVVAWLTEEKPMVFVCGHSHILRVMYDQKNQWLAVNPGAIGNYGIQKVRTMISCVIDNNSITEMNVIELGPKKL